METAALPPVMYRVLSRANVCTVHTMLMTHQVRMTDHLVQIPNEYIP